MINKKTLSSIMSELGSSKSDKKIAASMANLERANKAKKLIFDMAKRRGCKCKDMEVVVKKAVGNKNGNKKEK